MLRFLLLMAAFTLVCLCSGCGSAPRAVVADTRPTAAQAQAQADSALSTRDLATAIAAAKQSAADADARLAQLTKDYAAAELAHEEAVMVWIGLAALFLAGAAEFLALYETALAWLLKPAGYALLGAAAVAFLVRVVLPWLGWIELLVFGVLVAVAGYSLRKTAMAQTIVTTVDAIAAKAEADAKVLLADVHVLPAAAVPAKPLTIPATAAGVAP